MNGRSLRCLARGSAAWLALCVPAPARAAEPGVAVRTEACPELDANEVALVLELELRDAVGSWEDLQTPPVLLECRPGEVRIAVHDPLTGKALERVVPEPPSTEGRERALALAVSQLFLTSWLELLLPEEDRPETPEVPPAQVLAATERAKRAVAPAFVEERSVAEPPAGAGTRVDARVSLLGAGGLRDLSEAFGTLSAGVRVGLELDRRWHLFSQVAFERGVAERLRGTIETRLGEFGAGLGWRTVTLDPLAIEARLIVSALYVRLEGQPRADGVRGGRSATAAGQVALEVGPSVDLHPVRLGLSLRGGVTLFAPEGTVSDEPSVSPSGPFVGVALSVGVML